MESVRSRHRDSDLSIDKRDANRYNKLTHVCSEEVSTVSNTGSSFLQLIWEGKIEEAFDVGRGQKPPTECIQAKRPGYSPGKHTLTPLQLVNSGTLVVGTQVTLHLFEPLGIPQSLCYEIRIAWRHLGLLDQDDCITSQCEDLALASGERRRLLLEQVVKTAYCDLFASLPHLPHASSSALKDAFFACGYEPARQRHKMLRLFKALCREISLPVDASQMRKKHITMAMQERDILAEIEQVHVILSRLHQLPLCPQWREEDLSWWWEEWHCTVELLLQAHRIRRKQGVHAKTKPCWTDGACVKSFPSCR